MNKRYILSGLVIGSLSLAASAQRANLPNARTTETLTMSIPGVDAPAMGGERGGNVVWSEDFSNGLAGNNPSGAWTRSGPHGTIWTVNTNSPRGGYTNANEIITSTTASNGFAKFASDSANSSWNNGTPTALPTAEFTDWDGSLESPSIDLSFTPQVELVFEQRSRWCCGDSPFSLEISTDGGASWPTVILANEGLPINQGAPGTGTTSAVTETRRFSLFPFIADDASNVRFRFHHNGPEAGTSHYYWQIDDVRIETLPEYEVRMNYAYTSTTGTGEEYGRIPFSQFPPTMNIGAEVLNYGSVPQTNVSVQCIIRDASNTEVFEETIVIGDLGTSASSVADAFVNLPVLGFGVYEATFTISSDQIGSDLDPTNNSLKRHFEVSPEQYSLDALGLHPAGTEVQAQLGTASFENNSTVNVLTMYEITSPTQAQSVTVILGSNSRAGNTATVEVFMLDTADVFSTPSNISSPINGIGSVPVSLTASHVSNRGVTVPFEAPINLAPGAYFVCARISGSGSTNATNDPEVFIADDATVPQPGGASMIYIPVDVNPDGTPGPSLYSNGNASAVRLNVSPIVSVDEVSSNPAISVFPNPTNGVLNIVSDAQGVSIVEVIDVLGANVLTTSFNGRTTVDLSGLAQGIYNVRVSNGGQSKVERITLH